jgi:hypothetical protein
MIEINYIQSNGFFPDAAAQMFFNKSIFIEKFFYSDGASYYFKIDELNVPFNIKRRYIRRLLYLNWLS